VVVQLMILLRHVSNEKTCLVGWLVQKQRPRIVMYSCLDLKENLWPKYKDLGRIIFQIYISKNN
jgi:hypothetical protein